MKLFIVNLKWPARPAYERDYEIKVCEKTVWAIDPNGRRYLLGASAFQTKASAERCRLALLEKLVNDSYTKRHRYPAWLAADRALTQLAFH